MNTIYKVGLCVAFGLLSYNDAIASAPPKNIVSMEQARKAALKTQPGTIKSGELEKEKGKWIYSFDIHGRDGKTHEVWVDAKNGIPIQDKIESPREESQEQKLESGTNP